MGALIMFTFVIVIANVGGFYFYFQDKKEAHKTKMKKIMLGYRKICDN